MSYKKTDSEQFSYYKDLYESQEGKIDLDNKVSRNKLADFIMSNRKMITSFLESKDGDKYKEESEEKTLWFDLIVEQRELFGLPKYIPYELFNIYILLIKTNNKNINFDDFLKMFNNNRFKDVKGEVSDNIDMLMYNGGGGKFHAISEVISNAADATNPQNVVGRFGKGFFQIGRFLENENDQIVVNSKCENNKAYQISLKNNFSSRTNDKEKNRELYVGSEISDQQENGTSVEIKTCFSSIEQEELINYIESKFRTNKSENVLVNGIKINKLDNFIHINGDRVEAQAKNIEVSINENGIKIIDYGVGMSSEELSTKLLFPNDTSKARKEPKEFELRELTEKEVSCFYEKGVLSEVKENGELKKEETLISLMVGGVVIESFHTETSNNIKNFILEFPSFTYLMENKNTISLTKEVIVSLEILLGKIHSDINTKQEKIAVLEILGHIVKYLRNRTTQDSSCGKYNIEKVLKKSFKSLKLDLNDEETTVLAGDPRIMQVLKDRENILFVSSDFETLEIKNIPGVQKLSNVENEDLPFYTIDFDSESSISYVITKKGILVDKKYLNTPETRNILNVLVNLNISYEIESERVFYGNIKDGKVIEAVGRSNVLEKPNVLEKIEQYGTCINSTSQIDDFQLKLEDLVLQLGAEYDFLGGSLKNKVGNLKSNKIIEKYSLSDFLDKDGELNNTIIFYLLSDFNIEIAKSFKEKSKYIDLFENISQEDRKSILVFQSYLHDIDERELYLNRIVDLFAHEASRMSLREIIQNLPQNTNIISLMKQFKEYDELGIDTNDLDFYDMYEENFDIFLGLLEKEVGFTVDGIVEGHFIDGGMVLILESGSEEYLFIKTEKGMHCINKNEMHNSAISYIRGITIDEKGVSGTLWMDNGDHIPFIMQHGGSIKVIESDSQGELIDHCSDFMYTPLGLTVICTVSSIGVMFVQNSEGDM
ncbi:MAG: hypothetical protein GY828_08210, partial [Candidatus Gracilibacteria bacterium]|nr:hypothetical protein [Candidatus Gracilibacteria bacterium]